MICIEDDEKSLRRCWILDLPREEDSIPDASEIFVPSFSLLGKNSTSLENISSSIYEVIFFFFFKKKIFYFTL